MTDHEKVAIHELRSAVHNLNEAMLRLTYAEAHLEHADSTIDIGSITEIKVALEGSVIPQCIRLIEGDSPDNSPN
jgi:hypothetical protein